jgi:hypothetical protein
MKISCLLLFVMFFLTSCEWIESITKSDSSSSISGTTDIPLNTVGNNFSPTVQIGGVSYPANCSATITKVEDGVASITIKSNLPTTGAALLIPAKYKDTSGKLDCTMKVKMTDKGILDYTNKDHDPFVLVKYDAKVGDKYTLEKSDGTTITREVIRKSTTDDYLWGIMLIKTIDVEQDSRIPGVRKIEYFTNHKFGLVGIRFYMEDGTNSQVNLYPTSY